MEWRAAGWRSGRVDHSTRGRPGAVPGLWRADPARSPEAGVLPSE